MMKIIHLILEIIFYLCIQLCANHFNSVSIFFYSKAILNQTEFRIDVSEDIHSMLLKVRVQQQINNFLKEQFVMFLKIQIFCLNYLSLV